MRSVISFVPAALGKLSTMSAPSEVSMMSSEKSTCTFFLQEIKSNKISIVRRAFFKTQGVLLNIR